MNEDGSAEGFESLELANWRQFNDVRIDFHPQLTILTGANASGKSTILGILARHFNWVRSYSSAPARHSKKSLWENTSRRDSPSQLGSMNHVGSLKYRNGVTSEIAVPQVEGASRQNYDITLVSQQPVTGVYLASHRSISGNYNAVATIPTLFGSADQIFDQFTNELRTRWLGTYSAKTPGLALKESLIAAAVFGDSGNPSVEGNPEASAIWHGFQEVLYEVFPKSLGYKGLLVRVPDVILQTETGDFILDEASGGLTAIIEVAWQIFLRSRGRYNFTVLLDEPENHLHPSLQREILPSLLRAFPNVQFIVATHSPFVVTATSDSFVYVLDYNDDRQVYSKQLDYVNKAGNADETLTRVLGLESTLPLWAEEKLEAIIDRRLRGSMSSAALSELRAELAANGLVSEYPGALVRFADGAEGNTR